MVKYTFTFLSILIIGIGCTKNENAKCEECVNLFYDCTREGGTASWTINGKSTIKSGGLLEINTKNDGHFRHFFSFSGSFDICMPDLIGSTEEDKAIGVGKFKYYSASVYIRDNCNNIVIVDNTANDFIEFTTYDGKTASGTFSITQMNTDTSACKHGVWEIKGSFKDIPVR